MLHLSDEQANRRNVLLYPWSVPLHSEETTEREEVYCNVAYQGRNFVKISARSGAQRHE